MLITDRLHSHQSYSAKEIALNVSMLFNLIPGKGDGIVWASWTIGVEILFYLMFPLVVIFLTTNFRVAACLIVSLAFAFAFHELIQDSHLSQLKKDIFINRGFLVHLPVFVLGLVVYSVFSSQQFKRIRARWIGVILIASALTIHIAFAYYGQYPDNLGADRSVLAWIPLVLGLTISPVKPIVNIVTRFYGRISYSVYLNHPIVLFLLTSFYSKVYRHCHASWLALTICFASTFIVLTPWAYVTYRLIEQPGIRIGSRLIKWMDRAATTTDQAAASA